jgi:putative hemolysin
MRYFVLMLAAALICGCIGGQEETTTTQTTQSTTTSTTISPAIGAKTAESYIRNATEYATDNCSSLILAKVENPGIPNSWRVTFTFECWKELHTLTVTVAGENVTSVDRAPVKTTCIIDSDCIMKRPSTESYLSCKDRVCTEQPFDSPASIFCLSMGHRLQTRKLSNGGVYLACRFINGNECEEMSYYAQRCGVTTDNLTDCVGYSDNEVCSSGYDPVCGKVLAGEKEPFTTEWKTFTNPCRACTSNTRNMTIQGYLMDECPKIEKPAVGGVYNPSAKFCEDNSYVYRIKKYASGREYGVCVFSPEDECNADDYFHGICAPKARKF